jgi:hypothetical protein
MSFRWTQKSRLFIKLSPSTAALLPHCSSYSNFLLDGMGKSEARSSTTCTGERENFRCPGLPVYLLMLLFSVFRLESNKLRTQEHLTSNLAAVALLLNFESHLHF